MTNENDKSVWLKKQESEEEGCGPEPYWAMEGGFFSRLSLKIAIFICPQLGQEINYKTIAYKAIERLLEESERQRQIDIDARHEIISEACTWKLKLELAEKRNQVLEILTNIQNENN